MPLTTPGIAGESSARGKKSRLCVIEYEDNLRRDKCGGQPGSIAGGQILVPQLVEHLIGDSGGPGSNPGLVRCIFSLPVTAT